MSDDWGDNPFATNDDDNPFADDSVKVAEASVPEYNPFDQPKTSDVNNVKPAVEAYEPVDTGVPDWAKPDSKGTSSSQSASKPTTTQPSAFGEQQSSPMQQQQQSQQQSQQQQNARLEAANREKGLKQLETLRQLEYAERERRAKQAEIQSTQGRKANFPNFPMWMRKGCIQPCFHLDINTEIPVIGQRITRLAYYSWVFLGVTYFWNMVCCLALLGTSIHKTDVSVGLAIAYFFLFTPCAYYCWFHNLYNGMRTDSSLKFGWFFLVYAMQFLMCALMAVGLIGWGNCGWIVTIRAVKDEQEIGILSVTGALMWTLCCCLQLWILRGVLKVYRSTGMSLDAMTQEAAIGVASNKSVQRAAVSAVAQGATNA